MTEEYYVFWGDYNVREKYTSKFKSNSDWAIYLPGKCNKFDLVKKSREYLESEDSISEEKERFADQFKPASRKGRQAKKMKEHSSEKKLLDSSQRKITDFSVIRQSSSSSTQTVSSKNWNSSETNKLPNKSDSEDEERDKECSIRIM